MSHKPRKIKEIPASVLVTPVISKWYVVSSVHHIWLINYFFFPWDSNELPSQRCSSKYDRWEIKNFHYPAFFKLGFAEQSNWSHVVNWTKMTIILFPAQSYRSRTKTGSPEIKALCSRISVLIRMVIISTCIEWLLYSRHYSKCFTYIM